ncbi:major facilitator superfamily domain-containing protein [Aspergillus aurantiobrunneus]
MLINLRFFAGAFGSSPLTNAGGVIADMFPASERGLAMTLFASAPFFGPVLGPVIGGFLGMNAGWRWVMGFLAAFSGALWIVCSLLVPETYGPVLLQRRAASLSKHTGRVYTSIHDSETGKTSLRQAFKTSLSRPWILLSTYMAIVYGTLYLCFGAFPIVFQSQRHWNQGVAGLAFLGVMAGMLGAILYSILDNKRYIRTQNHHAGYAPPEARLPPCLVGSIAVPNGLFWFAWTTFPLRGLDRAHHRRRPVRLRHGPRLPLRHELPD